MTMPPFNDADIANLNEACLLEFLHSPHQSYRGHGNPFSEKYRPEKESPKNTHSQPKRPSQSLIQRIVSQAGVEGNSQSD
ncbi:MAG: hypothetical protein AAGI66_08640 [Cyanobacteria bacterium P01_H01_bin.74]